MSTLKLFDSHCHLHFSQYDGDREEVINRIKKAGVSVVNVGVNLEDSRKAVELAEKYPDFMRASIGIHPHKAKTVETDWRAFKKLASGDKVTAIGECGLDYASFAREQSERLQKRASAEAFGEGGFSKERTKERQKEVFIKQIKLAKELNKPLIVHCRPSAGTQDAYNDALDILISSFKFHVSRIVGVAHFFAGSKETAKKFLDLGFYISFAGPVTFAEEYKEVVEFVPMDRILIETDAPFAAPEPHRGKRNEPLFVEFVARQIAEWKGVSFDKVSAQTHNNAKALFKI